MMVSMIGLCLLVSANLSLIAPAVRTEDRRADDNDGLSVTVAFGSGLNTPGSANHRVLPPEIKVRQDSVVHYLVSDFHMVVVYKPETELGDIIVPAFGTFILDPTKIPPTEVFFFGINPQGGPLGTAATTNPLDGSNRQESVSFSEPGTYLVICNVGQHSLNGMFAFVKMVGPDEDL